MDDFESFAPDDQPSLVRPYTLTSGRTDSRVNLPLEAPIQAASSTARAPATRSSRVGDVPFSALTTGSEELSTAR